MKFLSAYWKGENVEKHKGQHFENQNQESKQVQQGHPGQPKGNWNFDQKGNYGPNGRIRNGYKRIWIIKQLTWHKQPVQKIALKLKVNCHKFTNLWY